MATSPVKTTSMDDFKVMLKKYSLKATRQRVAVHQAMLNLGHASADMVSAEIGSMGWEKITVATVYNILSQLADLGIYARRLSSNNKMYFDVNTYKHIHLYDKVNNTYKDVLDEDLLSLVQSKLSRRRFKGYKIEDVDIQIICRPSKTKNVVNK